MASSGIVKAISGSVKVLSANGEARIVQIGDRILSDELIVTGEDGAISIQLADGSEFDLGRNASTNLNDAFAETEFTRPLAPQSVASAQAEVAEIQQALATDPNFDPTQLEAPAAGPTAAGGGPGTEDNGHSVVEVDYLNPQMTPVNGFETEGINVVFPELVEDFILNPQQPLPVSTNNILAENSALDETSGLNSTTRGSLRINGEAPQSVELSASGATWISTSNTLEAPDYSVFVDANGDYTFTLLNALLHPDGSGPDNIVEFAFNAQLTDATGNLLTTSFGVKVYDDGPEVVNHDGSINNTNGEVLPGLIDYNGIGVDGLGSVKFGEVGQSPDLLKATYNGDDWTLTSKGDKLSFEVTDVDGDNVQELHGFIDKNPPGWQGETVDRSVFTLEPTAGNDYKLVLHDVLDMPVERTTLDFNNAVQPNVSSVIVYSDTANQGSQNSALLVEGVTVDPLLDNGFIGIGDNIMNSMEQTVYRFGNVDNAGVISQTNIVNDVQLHQVNNPVGGDAVIWTAKRAGAVVGSSSFIFTAPDDGTTGLSPAIHVDGGYDTLEITSLGGFQVSGLTYIDQSIIDNLSLDILFGFNVTDHDNDSIGGQFTVAVGNSTQTELGQLLSTPTPHEDSNLINNLDIPT